ncbi:MAG: cytochrome c [Planctomycetes bacterium]|nr:cytochrome c [Planctomycetota bacterium]
MTLQRLLLAAGAASVLVAFATPEGPATPAPLKTPDGLDAKALYMEHCASCHGETGDGKGNEELERPARSFLLGGYSYGNTQNAVRRSVIHGIPGTPMPAFGATLGADEINAVADYVISLGPPGTIVQPGESVLVVEDRPMVVKGMMPAHEQGAFREPRSLVVGFPNGTTFQFRAEDSRLLTVRQGEFLDRRDWGGRGGAELQPLGSLTWKASRASRDFTEFSDAKTGKGLRRKVKRTEIKGDDVWIHFDLIDGAGDRFGGGQEFLSFLMVNDVPVPMRAILGSGEGRAIALSELPGKKSRASNSIDVTTTPNGLVACALDDAPNMRIYLHAPAWTPSLAAAFDASLQKKD